MMISFLQVDVLLIDFFFYNYKSLLFYFHDKGLDFINMTHHDISNFREVASFFSST